MASSQASFKDRTRRTERRRTKQQLIRTIEQDVIEDTTAREELLQELEHQLITELMDFSMQVTFENERPDILRGLNPYSLKPFDDVEDYLFSIELTVERVGPLNLSECAQHLQTLAAIRAREAAQHQPVPSYV